MSALPNSAVSYRPMRIDDLDTVCAIERRIYPFPWSRGNFVDSLIARYTCTVMHLEGSIVGYGILTAAAGEAHLLLLTRTVPDRAVRVVSERLPTPPSGHEQRVALTSKTSRRT